MATRTKKIKLFNVYTMLVSVGLITHKKIYHFISLIGSQKVDLF